MALRNIQKQGTFAIANGAAVSDALEVPVGFAIAAIEFPSAWTAADLGFQISTDGGTTFLDVIDPANAAATSFARIVGIPTAAVSIGLSPRALHDLALGIKVKVTSINTASNAAVNQGAARAPILWVGRQV